MINIFAEGEEQDIAAVLAERDERVQLQQTILQQFPEAVLLDVKLNVPGPIKNNRYLERLFAKGIVDLEDLLRKEQVSFKLLKEWNKPTGCENFYLLTDDAARVKKIAMAFEDQTSIGRLFDADVLVKNDQQALSRSSLKLPVRRCFLCKRPAKDCARSRRHSVAELQDYISQLYQQTFN